MAEQLERFNCPKPGCHPESEDGCIEGLALKDCPHRHSFKVPEDEVAVEATLQTPTLVKQPADNVKLHNGDAFTTEEVDGFLRRKGATVVAFLGCPGTGKTTAAVMIYELLKRQRLGRLGFAGSNTIRGFQKRSFKSLVSSGLGLPDTERTSGSTPVQFLHLRICVDATKCIFRDVVLSDRTGEDFEACIKKPNLCASYPEIPRADCHVLLIDGDKLISDDYAALHIADVRKIFVSLIRSPIKKLQIVLTKFDTVSQSLNKNNAMQRFNDLVVDLERRANNSIQIKIHNLAARPLRDETLTGHGLEALVAEWFDIDSQANEIKKYIPKITDGTPYDLLLNTIQVS